MRTKRLTRLGALALFAGAALGVPAAAASAATIQGAGSTLVAPLANEWASVWGGETHNSVQYQSVGSGAGLRDISAGLVDFGASDAPLSASSTSCSGCVQIPWALTATGIGFNLGGIHRLHLTGDVLAKIYLGQITKWNDGRITKLNRGTRLPNLRITPFHRLDGSGDTYAFADYESHINSTFRNRIGTGVSLSWPTPASATGNGGMVNALQTRGAIAYVAVSYLAANNLGAAALKNAAGNYEVPNFKNIANAAAGVHSVPSSHEIHLVNPGRSQRIAYPISTFSYVIVHRKSSNGRTLKAFITWALGTGQGLGPRLDFVPIPRTIKNAGLSALKAVS